MELLGGALVLGAMLWLLAFVIKGRSPGLPSLRLPGAGARSGRPPGQFLSRLESAGLLRAVALVVVAELMFSEPFADWLATGQIEPVVGAAILLGLGLVCVFARGAGDALLGVVGLIAGSWAIVDRYDAQMLLVVGAVALMIAWISGAMRRVTS